MQEEIKSVSPPKEDEIWLQSSCSLRKLIGVLGMGLPFLLLLFVYIYNQVVYPLESISHYFYTRANSVFVVILSLLAVFLIIYKKGDKKGEKIDFIISVVAGVFALCVVLFPTSNITDYCGDLDKVYSVTIIKPNQFRENFHYLSAGIFLSCLAYMSLFLFTKSDKSVKERNPEKKKRNRIYRICGILMIVAMAVIGLGYFEIIPKTYYDDHQLTFWMETLAVESFGFSWLIKGGTLFKDKNEDNVSC